MSAIRSLLNMAALRSRTLALVACQLGSPVSTLAWIDVAPAEVGCAAPLADVLTPAVNRSWNICDVAGSGIENAAVVLEAPGEANGDCGALHGWVTCMFSRCDRAAELWWCGGDKCKDDDPLLRVSTENLIYYSLNVTLASFFMAINNEFLSHFRPDICF